MSSSPDFAEIYRNFGAQNNEFLKVCSFAAVCLRNSSADYAPGLEAEAMMSLVDGEGGRRWFNDEDIFRSLCRETRVLFFSGS